MFLLRKRFWLTVLKVLALAFVGGMIVVQIPELAYDLGPKQPIQIRTPADLDLDRLGSTTFVMVHGKPDFERAFVYRRYGLSYSYFNVQPYGMRLVVRTCDRVTDEWEQLNRFLGKLRPFNRQPFSYRIRDIYRDRFGVEVPDDAFFLALDDVPRLSGWQVGAVVFASILWAVMFCLFFLWRRKRPPSPPT